MLVLCEVSAHANRPVMWMPKYDNTIRASCRTLAVDGCERIIVRKLSCEGKECGGQIEMQSSVAYSFLFLVILGKGLEDRETGKVGAQMWGV